MQKIAAGLAALLSVAFWGPAMGQSVQDEIQQSEQPGSQIEIDIGGGGDADPVYPDPVDAELPGEGPESLSGPDDEDPLPY